MRRALFTSPSHFGLLASRYAAGRLVPGARLESSPVSVALVTGSAGLIGSEAVRHFASLGLDVVGIDNDMRKQFFGPEASTAWNVLRLTSELGERYAHHDVDIRDRDTLAAIF